LVQDTYTTGILVCSERKKIDRTVSYGS